jgi:peptidylprolyl isomerase
MMRSLMMIAGLAVAAACNGDVTGLGAPSDPATETFAASLGVNIADMTKTSSGVYYKDLVVGADTALISEKTTSVNATYSGYLKDGTLFESATNTVIDMTQTIPGFRDGIIGMRQGGKRKIVIPSELGYDGRSVRNLDGTIKIPRQSTLVFDVEILVVTNPSTTS